LKISWHELMLILSEERNPQKIVERIEKNEFWKFLDVMPTPILTEKSIPIAFLSEPEHPNSEKLSNLANTYYENGKYKAAIISIKQAIEKDENNSNFYIQLGDYYTVNNEIESAKIAYETAIDKDPYNSMAYNSYGCFWQEIYQWKRSYLCFKKAIELNPLDEVIVNSFESSCDYLVDYGIWTNQQKMIKLDELKKRIDQIFEIESIRQFS
jgi:tetratricopeptide (TPR) repeat protein